MDFSRSGAVGAEKQLTEMERNKMKGSNVVHFRWWAWPRIDLDHAAGIDFKESFPN